MHEFLKLLKRMGIQRKYVFLLIGRSPFDALRAWMLASLMKNTFLCLENGDGGRLWAVCAAHGLICALLFFYNGAVWSVYGAFSAKAEVRMQKILLQKLMSLPLKQADGCSADWITKCNSDVQAVNTLMSGPLNVPHVVTSILSTVLSSFLMFGSSRLLFAVTWVLVLPHLFLNYQIVLKGLPERKEEALKAMAESTSVIEPLVAQAEVIRLYDAGKLMMKRCRESSGRLMKLNRGMHVRNALSGAVLQLFGCGGFFVLLAVGYDLALKGMMSLAEVMYCLQLRLAILAGMLMLFNSMNNVKANLVCVKRIHDLLKEEGVYEG